jgi:hypothetical protein
MSYKLLFVFIGGNDDERFFDRIIKPKLEEKYTTVSFYKYAKISDKKIRNFLRNIKAMNANYICVTDINNSPCVTAKKQELQNKFARMDENEIVVVIREIESWYLAGLGANDSKKLGIKPFNDTNNLTKEQFDSLIPNQFGSRVDFMQESLKYFQIQIAKQKNKSFKYFFDKHDCYE